MAQPSDHRRVSVPPWQMEEIRARMLRDRDPLDLARRFHEAYERLAPQFGYETRVETREFDPASPNGRLMVAVCQEIIREGC
jgi:hypothetical protein